MYDGLRNILAAWREILHISAWTGLSLGALAGLAALFYFVPLARKLAVAGAITVLVGWFGLIHGDAVGRADVQMQWNDAKAAALSLTSRIQRLGWRDDATSLLACGDLLLHTAEYEGMPLAILEAMAVGLPCAVSDSLRRELPFLDATNSITPDKIPSDPILLQRLGQSARALAVKSFSTAKMSTSYQKLYLQLMKKKD